MRRKTLLLHLLFHKKMKQNYEKKVFEQIKLKDLKKETGFKTRLEFHDKHLDKDDLAHSLEKFEEFEDLNRSE